MKRWIVLLGLLVFVVQCHKTTVILDEPIFLNPQNRTELLNTLEDICQWAIEADLGSGRLEIDARRKTSIFVNSNLGRVLLAGYDLTQKEAYLDESLRWFDHLVELQQETTTPDGRVAGYWGDLSPEGNIYLGDAGTAATALAGAVRYTTGDRKERYLNSLKKYADFVRFGTQTDPQNRGRGGSEGWIIQDGPHAGALGCGYYRGELSTAPYSISTAVTGGGFFSALYLLTDNPDYIQIAENAVAWLLRIREEDGEVPYILHNFELDSWPLDTMSYFADGLIGVHMRSPHDSVKVNIETRIPNSIEWCVDEQNRDGTWGKLRSEDQQRSQGIINLLVWYYEDVRRQSDVLNAIRKNYRYFSDPDNSQEFGVTELPVTTGFVGLAIAEMLEPGITYRIQ